MSGRELPTSASSGTYLNASWLELEVRAGELHILMIKRADREGDPWSGHMAFPGGRMDKADAHGYAVAVRETEEEVGLSLGPLDQCIGRLSDLNARPHKGSASITNARIAGVLHLTNSIIALADASPILV